MDEMREIELRGALARGYCAKENSHKTIDIVLLDAMIKELLLLPQEPKGDIKGTEIPKEWPKKKVGIKFTYSQALDEAWKVHQGVVGELKDDIEWHKKCYEALLSESKAKIAEKDREIERLKKEISPLHMCKINCLEISTRDKRIAELEAEVKNRVPCDKDIKVYNELLAKAERYEKGLKDALQEIGKPTTSYAPDIELGELLKIRTVVTGILNQALKDGGK